MTESNDLPPGERALAELLRRAARDEAPPAAARAAAIALAAGPQAVAWHAAAVAAVRRLVALALPGASGPGFAPALGVRGTAAEGRQWLFAVEGCEIDLRTVLRGERWHVEGQLFGMPGAQRVLLDGGAAPASVAVGPTFEFAFADIAEGRYRLTVQAGALEIVVPQFDIGAAEPG
jgi:hypothetical protein